MILPRGITGFYEGGPGAAPPAVDPKSFGLACYAAARAESGKVEKLEPAGYTRNYHRAILRLRDEVVAVLCNAHYPWVAFAEANDVVPLRFREVATLASRFSDAMSCQVVSLSSLEASPDAESLADLGPAERKQIHQWRPPRLGDVIFNFWD